ncbi:M48 family metallopeptidase [Nocardia africana]|uniref:M48 family metallopeptidase n=1 Tax=Nocardia africana TaxID=134964 RepID=A0ABW6NQW4_9NOCA
MSTVAIGPRSLHLSGLDILVTESSARRTVSFTVERDATISAVVPPGVDDLVLAELVRAKRRWLYTKLAQRQTEAAERPSKRFITGEGFHYLGRSYRLQLVDDGPAPVQLIAGRLRLRRDDLDHAATHLASWYRDAGRRWLPPRIHPWADRMRAPLERIDVRALGYRWGSCGSARRVNLHWATMQLSSDLIDYVLVHELAHLHHPDHGPKFWQQVERVMPDYATRRARLDEAGARLWFPDSSASTRWRDSPDGWPRRH